MHCPLTLRAFALTLVVFLFDVLASADADEKKDVSFQKHIAPFLAKHCTKCHGGAEPKAELALDTVRDAAVVAEERESWETILEMLEMRAMPPEGRPRPSEEEYQSIIDWIRAELDRLDCDGQQHPGRMTLRRLNRTEYNNTIRDLLGVDFKPAEDFPADDVGYGFDNIADVLSLPPLLMEKSLAAAEKIAQHAIAADARPGAHPRIITCRPGPEHPSAECAREILERLAARAYRRPLRSYELGRLLTLFEWAEKQGESFEQAIQLALEAILVSPHFLFRVELDRGSNDAPRPVNDYELATRLSYFLWSSMPDERLFALARRGVLRDNKVLQAQVQRMLRDPKSSALVDNFAAQWLNLRKLEQIQPDPALFPGFDQELRAAMRKETDLFFEAIVRENRSILDLLDADFTFLNERLAAHYGIAGVKGQEFRQVQLDGDERGGVLTQASILTLTSNPTRTSPVKRGKWILENFLGTPPPPPPPGVEELSEDEQAKSAASLRKRMELHRSKPICASCHSRMDPLGFGLENFDPIGAWRDLDGKFPIDASGTLPSGHTFDGPGELRSLLKETRREQFSRCLSEKMLIYALGRGLEDYDNCAVNEILKTLVQNDYKFSSLILGVVNSTPFLMRGADGGDR